MLDEVLEAMKQAADEAILPRFQALLEGDIEEKSPGEVVTRADREAEQIITGVLQKLLPQAIVVGEEATALDPSLLQAVSEADRAWLVDPLDGTANFVKGSEDFAVMVALLEKGETTHAWIWQPRTQVSWVSVRGSGVEKDGMPLRLLGGLRSPSALKGAVLTRFLSDEHKRLVQEASSMLGEILPGRVCAGIDYPLVVSGEQDFALFRRTLPWDHAAGALVLREAGGEVRRWDGSQYEPGYPGEGILAAATKSTWERASSVLLPPSLFSSL